MKNIIYLCMLFPIFSVQGQSPERPPDSVLIQQMETLQTTLRNVQYQILQLENEIDASNRGQCQVLDSILQLLEVNHQSMLAGERADQQLSEVMEAQMQALTDAVKRNRLFLFTTFFFLLLFVGGLWVWLYRRMAFERHQITTQMDQSLEEKWNHFFNAFQSKFDVPVSLPVEEDHAFALKIADEITRMEKNLSRLADDKGLKPLQKGIERMKDQLAAQDYELSPLLHRPFDERMTVEVIQVLEDDTMEAGTKIISRIIRPQVLYQGKLIQRAQVEITQHQKHDQNKN